MLTLILLAGGNGTRMNNSIPKQFMLIGGRPMIMHTLDRIEKIDEIDDVIIVCKKEHERTLDNYKIEYGLRKKIRYAPAGATRQESVYNGLKMVNTEKVIIHEAARPFVKESEFRKLINIDYDYVTYTLPIPFTVLKADNEGIYDILNRDELVNIQLPQKFITSTLLEVHEMARNDGKTFTEDASMIVYYKGIKVKHINGTSNNIKITNETDLIIANEIYKEYIIGR